MRDKEKDAEWRRKNNRRFVADININLADYFREQLEKEGIPFQTWLTQQIKAYTGWDE